MGLIFLLLTILFFGIGLWLWQLPKYKKADFTINSSIAPLQYVEIRATLPKPNLIKRSFKTVKEWLEKSKEWLEESKELLLVQIFAIGIVALCVYLFISGQIFLAILAILFLLVAIILYRRQIERLLVGILSGILGDRGHRYFLSPPRDFLLPDDIFRGVEYKGEAILPRKVYVGDSQDISIELIPSVYWSLTHEDTFRLQDKESGKVITLQIRQDVTAEQFLEIELQAGGFTVDGDKKQKYLLNFLNSHKLLYRWNCYCPNSGSHWITLTFKVICSSDIVKLGEIKHCIKVVKLDHLTQRQVWMFATLAGVAGFITSVTTIVSRFPGLSHILGIH
jgi:hypothetical protein